MKNSYTFQEIKEKMVKYCVYQDRCHQEVEQKMREFMLIPEAKEEILLYLMKERFLDEERFTRSYIRGKFYIKHWGRNKIRNRLRMKGVTDKLAERCMDEIDEDDYIKEFKKQELKKLETLSGLTDFEKRQTLVKFLMQRGFEYEVIKMYAEEMNR